MERFLLWLQGRRVQNEEDKVVVGQKKEISLSNNCIMSYSWESMWIFYPR